MKKCAIAQECNYEQVIYRVAVDALTFRLFSYGICMHVVLSARAALGTIIARAA